MANQQHENPQHALSYIRLALLAGVLLFGGIAWGLAWEISPDRGMAPDLIQGIELYVWAGFALLFLGAVGGISLVRMRWEEISDFEDKRTYNIIGWAVAEVPGLLGATYLMLVGDPTFFALGFVLLGGTAFVWLPVPDVQSR